MVFSLPYPLNSLRFVNTTLALTIPKLYTDVWMWMMSAQVAGRRISVNLVAPLLLKPPSIPGLITARLPCLIMFRSLFTGTPRSLFSELLPSQEMLPPVLVTPCQVQGLYLLLLNFYKGEVLTGTFLQPVKVSVSESPVALQCISHGYHFGQFLLHCQW